MYDFELTLKLHNDRRPTQILERCFLVDDVVVIIEKLTFAALC